MNNVYDNGGMVIGTAYNLAKYINKLISQLDYTEDAEAMLKDVKEYDDDDILVINYSTPMDWYTIEKWSKEDKVNLDYNKIVDESYEIMKKYIMAASEEELKRHFEWYKVENENRDDLLNTMFESYANTYPNDEKLLEKCKELLDRVEDR